MRGKHLNAFQKIKRMCYFHQDLTKDTELYRKLSEIKISKTKVPESDASRSSELYELEELVKLELSMRRELLQTVENENLTYGETSLNGLEVAICIVRYYYCLNTMMQ